MITFKSLKNDTQNNIPDITKEEIKEFASRYREDEMFKNMNDENIY